MNNNKENVVEIPDFDHVDINHWSVGCTLPVIFAHFIYLCGRMTWLATEGKRLLDSSAAWTYSEFKAILENVWQIYTAAPQTKTITSLYQFVLRKAIASLFLLVSKNIIDGEQADEYFLSIQYQLRAGAACGVNSHSCRAEDSVEMIDSMTAIAQVCKSERMLELLSSCRHPGRDNELPRKLYVANFKNW
ncbi:MAG: hypothetical protein A3H57_03610 [Candidatus Taylorbacteria bacterium RIFCSPLOWO2_02_FULL_43_11]|uniref:Uncharacterized protein n=1 Tax=Candidatus Taylorbacteria bacterium RIFCSPHIGHO2_02_FULL_43_32b TaxID=1802306 RepID=A0A1G2MLU0_9BACT|nr:MAG: hypothetical protein A3C72_03175 [Candidatus Taylorbacteria bacterium RIFCSPHIGHO2_02_FULL_43_32b]OHA35642.1 MAG: hypothetical protein A3H57_03610 [Candidatus Taylorbacteria bacterium RIFCSPLOWO2_02_FULL_43_11]